MPRRPSLPVVPDGCPADRGRCIRIGCAHWSASSITPAGSVKLGLAGGDGVTVPRVRTKHANVNDELLERAADFVVERANAGHGCVDAVIAANPDGLSRPAVARILGGTRESIRLVEERALAKVGAAAILALIRHHDWTPHGSDAAEARKAA